MKRQYIALNLAVLLWFHLPLVSTDVPKSDGKTDAPESGTSATDAQVQKIKAQILEAINEPKISKTDLDEILTQVKRMRDENVFNSNDINDLIAEITRKKLETGPQADVQSQPLGNETTDTNVTQKKTSSDSSSSRSVKGRPSENTRSEFPHPDSVVPIVTTPLVNNDDQIPVLASKDPSGGKHDDDHVVLESIDRKKKKDPIERIPKDKNNSVPKTKTQTPKSNSGDSKNKIQVKSNDNPRPKPTNGAQKANGNTSANQNTGPKKANGSPGPKQNTANQNAKKTTGPKAKSDKNNPTKDDKEPILPVKVFKNVGKFVGGLVG